MCNLEDNGSGDIGRTNCLKEQQCKYYCYMLYDYLSGMDRFPDIMKLINEAGLPLSNPFLKIALIYNDCAGMERVEEIRYLINKRLEDAEIPFLSFYSISGKLLYVLNHKAHQGIPCDYIFYEHVLNSELKLYCGVSTSMEGIQMLRKLFMQADSALKESMFKGVKVYRYDEISKDSNLVINIRDYIKLLDLFSRGSLNEIHMLVEDIFIRLINAKPNAKDTINMLFNMLNYLYINLSTIYKDVCDMEEVRISFKGANNIFNMKVIVIETIDEMYARVMKANKMEYSNHIINYLINEVKTRYNTKITLYELADKLAMNYSYISGVFAKNAGITFQEYLQSFRLDKARELMLSGEFRMNRISERCGFYDSHFFSKAFKKRFNMTPGEYARNITTNGGSYK
jgi:AraC-type DNA-binding domain-containing proteins